MYIFIILLLPFIALISRLVIMKQYNEIENKIKEFNNDLKRLSEDIKYREEVLKRALNNNCNDLLESIKKDLKNKNNVKS